jgi:hypothetical protein
MLKAAQDYYNERKDPFTFGDPRYAFIAGAKFGAYQTQRVGEILQKYCDSLPPQIVKELREIMTLVKEINDE